MSQQLKTQIDQLGEFIYRICIPEPSGFIAFNHYLVVDEFPLLMHLGHQKHFETLKQAVGEILEPDSLRYLAFSHYEADECGAMNDWLTVAPQAEVLTGKICATTLNDSILRLPKVLKDGESVSLGRDSLIMLETPHFPHNWDACLFYLQGAKVLFGSDLGTQLGVQPLFGTEDPSAAAMAVQEKLQYMPWGVPLTQGIDRVRALDFETLAAMHGSVFTRPQADWFLTMLAQANQREMEALITSMVAGKSSA